MPTKYLGSWGLPNMKLLIDKLMSLKKLDNKIKIVGFLFLVAIILVLMPSQVKKAPKKNGTEVEALKTDTEKALSEKLSKISGIEKADVMITYENDGVFLYQTDDKINTKEDNDEKKSSSQAQTERKTVFDGGKNTIIKSRKMPEIKGVCIFYSGKKDILTEKSLYNAVKGSLGVELHKIEVIYISG